MPEDLRPVLAAVDDRHICAPVVRRAAREAAIRGTGLHVLHVVDWPVPPSSKASAHSIAGAVTGPYARLLRQEFPLVPVRQAWAKGRVPRELASHAESAQLLVLGHHSRTRAGSVSLGLCGRTPCPVLVVATGVDGAHETPVRLVVAGIADTEGDALVLEEAFAEAERHGAELEIIHADRRGTVFLREDTVELRIAPLRARHPGVLVALRIELASERAALVDATRRAGVLVLGSRGHSGIHRLITGSVNGFVLQHAHCPVLVVPVTVPAVKAEVLAA